MWIISTKGFYPIVQKPWDVEKNTLTVCSRVGSDLNALRRYIPNMEDINSDEAADYRHRIQAPKKDVAAMVAKLVREINYPSFKHEVHKVQGVRRMQIYVQVWDLLSELEELDELETEGK